MKKSSGNDLIRIFDLETKNNLTNIDVGNWYVACGIQGINLKVPEHNFGIKKYIKIYLKPS